MTPAPEDLCECGKPAKEHYHQLGRREPLYCTNDPGNHRQFEPVKPLIITEPQPTDKPL